MTTTTATYHQPVKVLVVLIFAVVVAAVAVGTALSHADLKHGSEAATVRQYLDNGNRIEVWWNPSNAHRIELCQVDKDLYGLRVLKNVDGKWEEITAFLKSKMSNLSQVEQYLTNSGATKIWVK